MDATLKADLLRYHQSRMSLVEMDEFFARVAGNAEALAFLEDLDAGRISARELIASQPGGPPRVWPALCASALMLLGVFAVYFLSAARV